MVFSFSSVVTHFESSFHLLSRSSAISKVLSSSFVPLYTKPRVPLGELNVKGMSMSKVVPEEEIEEVNAAANWAVMLKTDQGLRGVELSDQYNILGSAPTHCGLSK